MASTGSSERTAPLTLGSVAGKIVEGMLILVGTLSLLALLNLGQELVAAGPAAASSSQAVAVALLAVRDWVHGFLMLLAWVIGALMYHYVLYRSRLVPRWVSGWGLIGAGLCLVSTVWAGFTREFGFTTVNTALNIPIGVQEMVLGVWLIAKGFRAVPAPAASLVDAPGT